MHRELPYLFRVVQGPGHFGTCLPIGTGKRHRQGDLNRIRRQTEVGVAARQLSIQINAKVVDSGGGGLCVGNEHG